MEDQDNQGTESEEGKAPDELSILKQRARLMGITHSNNISLETLKAKIAEVQNGTQDKEEDKEIIPMGETAPRKALTLRQHLQRENLRLVRVRLQNLDPKKKDLPGEVFTVANDYLGSIKKFIPYGEASNNGYHIPYCIYNRLKKRMFLNIRTFTKNGQVQVETKWAREFSIDVLEPLTQSELRDLALTQAASHALN